MAWRSPNHRRFVASQGCCIRGCTRQPVDAHHLRIGHGMGMKASDKWCVPLCRWHHTHGGKDAVHGVGSKKELEWFAERGIDAVALAKSLYAASKFKDEPSAKERKRKVPKGRPMPGTKRSGWRKKLNGKVERREG